MTWQVLITVFTLGGIGAMVRGSIIMILASSARIFPMSILLVNILAAFLGGFILSLQLPSGLNAALSIGLVGGIGTLSSIHGNLLDLFFDKAYRRLALYLLITIFGGVLIAQAGMSTGSFILNLVRGPQDMQTQLLLDSLKQQENTLDHLKQYNAQPALEQLDPELLEKLQQYDIDPNTLGPSESTRVQPDATPEETSLSEPITAPANAPTADPKLESKSNAESAATFNTESEADSNAEAVAKPTSTTESDFAAQPASVSDTEPIAKAASDLDHSLVSEKLYTPASRQSYNLGA